jgi:hypothetical protein
MLIMRALLVLLGITAVATPLARGVTLERLGWLAGCWELRAGDRVVEEQWMAPRGSVMVGMTRTTVAGALRSYEHSAIREEGDTLVYRASPSGQPSAEFRSLEVSDSGVVFANPTHDFPQRVIYRRAAGGDSLRAAIEGTISGRLRRVDYPYARVPCRNPA